MVAFLLACLMLLQTEKVEFTPKMTVHIPRQTALEGMPIPAALEIIHTRSQIIDLASFRLDSKPLKVELIQESVKGAGKGALFSKEDPDALIVSEYRFQLPAHTKGLYFLGILTAQVGKIQVRATQVTYEVLGTVSSGNLQLSANMLEKSPIYPGQKVTFEYRIVFREPIELVKEEYALFGIDGFRMIASPQIVTSGSKSDALEVITQQAVALRAGTFRSNPSSIQGFAYTVTRSGKKEYLQPKIEATAEPLEITITPFPEEGKPDSFNGNIGVFSWKVELQPSRSVMVGEKIKISCTATGKGNLEMVNLPDIKTQKGFQGSFAFGDLMPEGQFDQTQKRFEFEIRPLTTDIKVIPSIEFSSFDPEQSKYSTFKSEPIPITVRSATGVQIETKKRVSAIEIEGIIQLTEKNRRAPSQFFKNYWPLLISLLFIYFLQAWTQKRLKKRADKKSQISSHQLFLQALKEKHNLNVAIPLIRKALLMRLYEIHETKRLCQHPEELSDFQLAGEIKRFLLSIDTMRFSSLVSDLQSNEIMSEASDFYHRMKRA
jgi:hypothetical protein